MSRLKPGIAPRRTTLAVLDLLATARDLKRHEPKQRYHIRCTLHAARRRHWIHLATRFETEDGQQLLRL